MKIIKTNFGVCVGCGLEPGEGLYAFFCHQNKNTITCMQCCASCFEMDAAIVDAIANDRRFTEIGVGNPFGGQAFYNGARCLCGSVSHVNLRGCIRCDMDERMLGKKQKEAKLMSKMLVDLRRSIKDLKKLSIKE